MRGKTLWISIAISACFLVPPQLASAQADPPTILPTQEIFGPAAPDGGAFGVAVTIDGRDLIVSRSDFTAHAYERDDAGIWRYIGQIPTPDDAQGFAFEMDMDEGFALLRGVVGSAGKVFVFRRTETGWNLQQTLTPPAGTFDAFGQEIALQGRTAIIGSGPDEVYVFRRNDNGRFVFRQTLRPTTVAGEGFATGIALDGDVALIGTSNTNNAAGSVFVFRRVNGVWRERQELVASDAQEQARFGETVALNGSTAVIGAVNHNGLNPGLPVGQAYVFVRADGHWFEQQQIPNDELDTLFGLDIEVVNERQVAITHENFQPEGASVRLFQRSDGNWALAAILSANPAPTGARALDSFRGTLVAADPVGDPQRVFIYRLRR